MSGVGNPGCNTDDQLYKQVCSLVYFDKNKMIGHLEENISLEIANIRERSIRKIDAQ